MAGISRSGQPDLAHHEIAVGLLEDIVGAIVEAAPAIGDGIRKRPRRIDHQDLAISVGPARGVDDRRAASLACHVGGHARRLAAGRADRLDRLPHLVRQPAGQYDPRAFPGQFLGHAASAAATAAGDDGDLPVQAQVHGALP
jgi:hypothetical protein